MSGRPTARARRALVALAGVLVLALAAWLLARRGRLAPEPPEAAVEEPAPLPPSTLTLGVRYPLSALSRRLEALVPRTLGEDGARTTSSSDPRLSYQVEFERGPLRLEVRGDSLELSAVVAYRGRLWYASPFGGEITASCGTEGEPPRVRVRLTTPLELDEDWRLRTSVGVAELGPASEEMRDRCRVSLPPFSLDATPIVVGAARERADVLAERVDSLLAAQDVRGWARDAWRALEAPAPVGADVWLVLGPGAVRRAPIAGTDGPDGSLATALALEVRPRVLVGPRPPTPELPLPPLEQGDVEPRFTLAVEARVGWDALASSLRAELDGRSFALRGREVRVTEVDVSPATGGRVAVALAVEGAVRGRVHLVGRPVLDPAGREIAVPDLAFSLATRNVLQRSAAWLAGSVFADRIRALARWPVEERIAGLRTLGARGLNRPLGGGARLEGSFEALRLQEVLVAPDALVLRARLAGGATLVVDGD